MLFILKTGAVILQKAKKTVAPMPHKTQRRGCPDAAKKQK
jgi:hypothetical protein